MIRGAGRPSPACPASCTSSIRITAWAARSTRAEHALANLEEIIQLEGPNHIAAFFLETVSGTNGVLIPPDGYMQGVRELCTKYGILMVCDEVMAGFGRTGEWFAINHWNVVPDLITMAKGLTSAYIPMGAVGMRRSIADSFKDKVFPSGLTYNSHTLACRHGARDDRRLRGGRPDQPRAQDGQGHGRPARAARGATPDQSAPPATSACSGSSSCTKDAKTKTPLAPFGGTSEEMKRLNGYFREEGLYTFVRWHTFFTNPPLCITEQQLRDGFAMIDRSLTRLEQSMA